MRYNRIIKRVKLFEFNHGLGIVQDEFNFKILSSNLEFIDEISFGTNIQTIKGVCDYFILNDIYGHGYIAKKCSLEKYDHFILSIDDQYLYCISDNLYKISIIDRKVEWTSDYSSLTYIYDDNYFITRSKQRKLADIVICINIEDGKCKWKFNLSELENSNVKPYQIKKFLYIGRGLIWIALNNHTVIALNTETGELIKQLSSISNFKSDWLPSSIPSPEAMQIDKQRNCLIGFMWEFYWEINPCSGEISFYDLTDYFKEQKIRNDKPDYVLGENHLYFICRDESKIGALNIETKKLDWIYTFKENDSGVIPEIMELKGNDSILGALDRGNTLHIFEPYG
jgi:outer membrane protein assembly factor BamB